MMIWVNELIEEIPRFHKFKKYLDKITKNAEENPALAIELCKALLESISKTILKDKLENIDNNESFTIIVDRALKSFKFNQSPYQKHIDTLGFRLLSILKYIGEIRNQCNFASHGQSNQYQEITKDLSLLVIHSTNAVLGGMLYMYLRDEDHIKPHINYDNLTEFNDYINEIYNSKEIDLLGIDIAEAIFKQKYDLYERLYLEYREDLEE